MMNIKTTLDLLRKYRGQWKWQKKIDRLLKKQKVKSHLSKQDKKNIYQYWKPYKSLTNLKWHKLYKTIYFGNNFHIEKFIPENLFYMDIEPFLNNSYLSEAYQDKNIYHKIFNRNNLPKVVLRNMHGIFYDEDYNMIISNKVKDIFVNEDKPYIIKPSLNTRQGLNVLKIHVKYGKLFIGNKQYETIDILEDIFERNFLVQEYINQHAKLLSVYEYSLNTIRMITVRKNGNIYCTSSVIRFGNDKRIVDNKGIACGIDCKGQLNTYATDLNMQIYYKHPFNDKEFSNLQIPCYESLKTFVRSMHKELFYFDMISWDIAIDENGDFKMIEFNLKGQEINFHQVNNGPLFGELTEHVLDQVYNK